MNGHLPAIRFLAMAVLCSTGCGDKEPDPAAKGPDRGSTTSAPVTLVMETRPSLLESALLTRTFKLPDGFFESDFAEGGDAQEILEQHGVSFVKGMAARFDRSEKSLEVKASEDELTVVGAVVEYWNLPQREAERLAWGAMAQRVERKLKEIVIPEIDFKEIPISEALAWLERESVINDPASGGNGERGVRITMDAPPSVDGQTDAIFANEDNADPTITLWLSQVPLAEALRYTASLALRRYRIEGEEIKVGYLHHFVAELAPAVFPVPPDLSQLLEEEVASRRATDPFADPSHTDESFVPTVTTWMERYGITFGHGASATHDPGRGIVIVQNSPDQLELVSSLLQWAATLCKSEEWQEARRASYEKKLDSIVLAELSFHDADLGSILDFLLLQSRLADRSGPVWEWGLPIWIHFTSYFADGDSQAPIPHLSFDMSHPTLRQALERICLEIGGEFSVGPEGVRLLVPRQ